MDNIKNDNYYLEQIRYCIDRIKTEMNDIDYDTYYNRIDLQEMTMFNLIQISENAKSLSNDYKNNNNDIPWNDVYGLRNKIVHDYGNVVLDIVYNTLTIDIPDLYRLLFLKQQ